MQRAFIVKSLGMYMYESVTCMTRLSPILTSEGLKHEPMLQIAREVEIRPKYRLYSAHCTPIAQAAGINCYKLIYLSRAII